MYKNLKFEILKLRAKCNTYNKLCVLLIIINIVIYMLCLQVIIESLCVPINKYVYKTIVLALAVIVAIISNIIFRVQKADGILLIKVLNTARVSMEYCNYEYYTDKNMFNMFEKSINLIFNSNYIEKLKVKKIYINTHSALANFIIKKLHQKNDIPYSKKLFKECVERGYTEIDGYKVITKYDKSKSNVLLTSRVSNSSDIYIKENSLKKKEHYKIIIPVELYYKQKLKA